MLLLHWAWPGARRRGRHAFGNGCIVNWLYLKSCAKCGGDLALDDGDWLCLQCGTYFYTGLYVDREDAPAFPSPADVAPDDGPWPVAAASFLPRPAAGAAL